MAVQELVHALLALRLEEGVSFFQLLLHYLSSLSELVPLSLFGLEEK